MTLTVALMKYFGKKEGEGLKGFAEEVRKLTDKDKQDFIKMLTPVMGEEITLI